MLTLRLLGPPEILIDGAPAKVTRRKSRALLYYLGVHDKPLRRESLLTFFWPDSLRAAAQQVLRTTLHGLRKDLGSALVIESEDISLSSDVQTDVKIFEKWLSDSGQDPSRIMEALELYRGEFLEGFTLPDTPDFEDWIVFERERLKRLAVRGWVNLSRIYESVQDYAAALDSLEHALAFGALQEDLQRESIRLMYLSGDRPAAIRRYDTLRRLLDEEMGVPPMLETRALYDAIINDKLGLQTLPPVKQTTSRTFKQAQEIRTRDYPFNRYSLPFTGREAELQSLVDLAEAHSLNQRPQLALIEGEAGIGKTRLAEEFGQASGALFIKGSATELQHALPYQPVIEALRGLLTRTEWDSLYSRLDLAPIWRDEIARLLPELSEAHPISAGDASSADARLWEGVHQFLLALGRQRRLILFLDDLHWADAASLSLLAYLIRQPSTPVFYLGSARPAPPRSPLTSLLGTLTRTDRLLRLSLNRLTRADIDRLARQLSSEYAGPLSEWLMRNTEGNPQVLLELVRYARQNQILTPNGAVDISTLTTEPVLTPSIYSLIQWRLSQLSNPARRVLDAAVAAGREFEFEVVYQAVGLSESAALDALDELLEVALINPLEKAGQGVDAPLVYAFDHSLTMEVAYREIGEARHRRLHRQVAEAMEKRYRNRFEDMAGMIANHYQEGGDQQKAAAFAIQAARRAASLAAWTEAASFYEQALVNKSVSGKNNEILMALGEAYVRSGQPAKAAESYWAVISRSEPGSPDINQARLALGEALLPQARFTEVLELTQQVIESDQPEFVLQAEFLAGTALSLEGADLEEAAKHLLRAQSMCVDNCDPFTMAEIKFELGSLAAQEGRLNDSVILYHESLEAAQVAVSENQGNRAIPRLILAYNNLAYHLHLIQDPQALVYVVKGLELASEKGELPLLTYLLSTRGEIALAAGDLELAESCFQEGLALAERVSMLERVAGLTANLGLVEHQRGQQQLAIHHLSTAQARADALGTQHLAAQIRLWLAPLLPAHEARQRLAEARAIASRGGRRRLLEEIARLEASLVDNGTSLETS
jgi:DNA-binding SARP family transcriptional activator